MSFFGACPGFTVLVFPRVTILALQHRAVRRDNFLLTLWCKPEANKPGTSLHQAVALCGAWEHGIDHCVLIKHLQTCSAPSVSTVLPSLGTRALNREVWHPQHEPDLLPKLA